MEGGALSRGSLCHPQEKLAWRGPLRQMWCGSLQPAALGYSKMPRTFPEQTGSGVGTQGGS